MIYFVIYILSILVFYNSFKVMTKSLQYLVQIGILMLLSVFSGVRDLGVGTDTLVYTNMYFSEAGRYESIIDIFVHYSDWEGMDSGYLILNYVGRLISDDVHIALFLTQIVVLFPIYFGIKNITTDKKEITMFFFLFLFIFFQLSMNAMRQMCALSIAFWAYSFLLKEKHVHFLLLMLIAYTFHSSVILFFAFPLINIVLSIKDKRIRSFTFVISIGLIIIAYLYAFRIIELFSIFVNDAYVERYSVGGLYEGVERINFMQIVYIFFLYFIFIYTYNHFRELRKFTIYALIVCTLYTVLTFLVLYVNSLNRMAFYANILNIYLVSFILVHNNFNKTIKNAFIVFIVLYWWRSSISLQNYQTYPYMSKILGIS